MTQVILWLLKPAASVFVRQNQDKVVAIYRNTQDLADKLNSLKNRTPNRQRLFFQTDFTKSYLYGCSNSIRHL